jgi:hypothetical protein
LHGKGKGAHHKRSSEAFKALAKFVATEHPASTVTQFCQQVVASRHTDVTTTVTTGGADDIGHGQADHAANSEEHGTPPNAEGGTKVADSHSGGASEHGTKRANDASGGHSAAGSGNAGNHRR